MKSYQISEICDIICDQISDMSKKAVYGILIALLLPLIGYIALKNATDGAVIMPRHYLPDSVVTKTRGDSKTRSSERRDRAFVSSP